MLTSLQTNALHHDQAAAVPLCLQCVCRSLFSGLAGRCHAAGLQGGDKVGKGLRKKGRQLARVAFQRVVEAVLRRLASAAQPAAAHTHVCARKGGRPVLTCERTSNVTGHFDHERTRPSTWRMRSGGSRAGGLICPARCRSVLDAATKDGQLQAVASDRVRFS